MLGRIVMRKCIKFQSSVSINASIYEMHQDLRRVTDITERRHQFLEIYLVIALGFAPSTINQQ